MRQPAQPLRGARRRGPVLGHRPGPRTRRAGREPRDRHRGCGRRRPARLRGREPVGGLVLLPEREPRRGNIPWAPSAAARRHPRTGADSIQARAPRRGLRRADRPWARPRASSCPTAGGSSLLVDGGNGHSGKRSHDLHFGLGRTPPATPLRVAFHWRDPRGRVRHETLELTPGWHTVLLGRTTADCGLNHDELQRFPWTGTVPTGCRPCGGSPLAITILNVLGHFVLGFEQSWAQPLVAVFTAYSVELILEALSAWTQRRRPHFAGGLGALRQLPPAGPHHGPGGRDAPVCQ